MKRGQNGLVLVEDFKGMNFVNTHRIVEDERFVQIKIEPTNANAIFMACFLLAATAVAYWFWGGEVAVMIFAATLMAGGMFVGAMYLAAAQERSQVLPHVDRDQEHLVLASGTTISKSDIKCFRQYYCSTKISRFKLVLTTVVTGSSNETLEFAVAPVIGRFSEDVLGESLARYFDVQLVQDVERKFNRKELADLGLC